MEASMHEFQGTLLGLLKWSPDSHSATSNFVICNVAMLPPKRIDCQGLSRGQTGLLHYCNHMPLFYITPCANFFLKDIMSPGIYLTEHSQGFVRFGIVYTGAGIDKTPISCII